MSRQMVGYILKTFPRYSQTFILNEIIEHQNSGCDLEIFALRRPKESVFHPDLAKVNSKIHYFDDDSSKSDLFWAQIQQSCVLIPDFMGRLKTMTSESVEQIQLPQKIAVRAREAGITHFHAHFGNVASQVARLASSLSGVPFSFTAHAKDIYHRNVDKNTFQKIVDHAETVVTVSHANKSYLVRDLEVPADKVQVVYNGLQLDDWEFRASQNSNLIIGIGRLVPKKGFDNLILACAELVNRGVDFRCEIIGEGELGASLFQQIEQLGLGAVVSLMGPKNSSEIKNKLREARCLVVPSIVDEFGDREGLPTVILESMAIGTPCIASEIAGIPEAVIDQETGLLVNQKDPLALADACQQLLDDKLLCSKLIDRARQHLEANFDIRNTCKNLRTIFSNFLVAS